MRGSSGVLVLVLVLASAFWGSPAFAQEERVFARMCDDAKAGRPVVVQVKVALCDNRVIRCGNRALGDGDDLVHNLYWGTSEGFFGWMKAFAPGWKIQSRRKAELVPGVLERVLWTRTIAPSARWRACGVASPIQIEMHVDAWRGMEIDGAVRAFVEEASTGSAHVVAYVGHNRWMDYERFDWESPSKRKTAPKGIIAIACYSREYLKPWLEAVRHVPLVLTNDFVMASGAPAVGAIDAFVEGASLVEVRTRATRQYAAGQGKNPARLSKVFVNASAAGW